MDKPEFLLHRMVQEARTPYIEARMKGRYSYRATDSEAWKTHTFDERRRGVRMDGRSDGSWRVECLVERKNRVPYVAAGEGKTLEEAYQQLVYDYDIPCVKPEMGGRQSTSMITTPVTSGPRSRQPCWWHVRPSWHQRPQATYGEAQGVRAECQ